MSAVLASSVQMHLFADLSPFVSSRLCADGHHPSDAVGVADAPVALFRAARTQIPEAKAKGAGKSYLVCFQHKHSHGGQSDQCMDLHSSAAQ